MGWRHAIAHRGLSAVPDGVRASARGQMAAAEHGPQDLHVPHRWRALRRHQGKFRQPAHHGHCAAVGESWAGQQTCPEAPPCNP